MEDVQRIDGLYGFEFREPDKRRVPTGERRNYDIKALWQRNHEIVNLAARGLNNVDIAEILGITPATVSNTINSELGRRKLSEIRLGRDEEAKKVTRKIREITNRALTTYHNLFEPTNDLSTKDKGNFALEFLKEMSGHRAPTKVQSQTIHTTLTSQELEEFKQRGIKAARESGLIIDVEPNNEVPQLPES